MERERKKYLSGSEDKEEAPKKESRFKIPKKKQTPELDKVYMLSPLSRIPDCRYENRSLHTNPWQKSTCDTHNKKRSSYTASFGERKHDCERHGRSRVVYRIPKVVLTDVLWTHHCREQHILDHTLPNVKPHSSEKTPTSNKLKICQVSLTRLQEKLQNQGLSGRVPKVLLSDAMRTDRCQEQHILDHTLPNVKPHSSDKTPTSNKLKICQVSLTRLQEKLQNQGLSGRWGQQQCKLDPVFKGGENSEERGENLSFASSRRSDTQLKDFQISNECSRAFNSQESENWSGDSLPSDKTKSSIDESPDPYSRRKQDTVSQLTRELKSGGITVRPGLKEHSKNHNGLRHQSDSKESEEEADVCKEEKGLCLEQDMEACRSRTPQQNPVKLTNEDPVKQLFSGSKENGKASPYSKRTNEQSEDQLQCLRKVRTRIQWRKRKMEPIVLSSDEEEMTDLASQSSSLGLDLKTTNSVIKQGPASDSKDQDMESEIHASEKKRIYRTPQGVSADEVYRKSPQKSITQTGPVLELEFMALHIGKVKRKAQGCVALNAEYFIIPLEDSNNKLVTLTVDTSQLKKYSLLEMKNYELDSSMSFVVFIWIASIHAEEIQKRLVGDSEKGSRSSEFLFFELHKSPSEDQLAVLKRIISEISERNQTPDLCETLTWNEIISLLSSTNGEESSFMTSCCNAFQQYMEKKDVTSETQQLSQKESNANSPEPNYVLCCARINNRYSVSIAPKPDKDRYSCLVQKLIVFPPPPTKGGLAVTNEDLDCLEEGELLNDVIIDFYLKYLLLEKAAKDLAARTHIFSSFFYRCLMRKDNNLTEEQANLSIQHRRHQRVKNWTRHMDIFTKDFIFVPVNQEAHWYLAIICFPWLEEAVYEEDPKNPLIRSEESVSLDDKEAGKESGCQDESDMDSSPDQITPDEKQAGYSSLLKASTSSGSQIQSEDSSESTKNNSGTKISKRPCILIMDSLRTSSRESAVKILREYLQVEWEVKKGTSRQFTKENMKSSVPRVPRQENSIDCGIYLLQTPLLTLKCQFSWRGGFPSRS
ncbi:sentrin-specific protease 7 isoform X2 [Latimeria chalumnae]|uniref:sentrin-specific protease 7 isoform X2 n=1 Tax=Latimeria chalumnae TaxID=7897 RepID=UPI00313AE6D8